MRESAMPSSFAEAAICKLGSLILSKRGYDRVRTSPTMLSYTENDNNNVTRKESEDRAPLVTNGEFFTFILERLATGTWRRGNKEFEKKSSSHFAGEHLPSRNRILFPGPAVAVTQLPRTLFCLMFTWVPWNPGLQEEYARHTRVTISLAMAMVMMRASTVDTGILRNSQIHRKINNPNATKTDKYHNF